MLASEIKLYRDSLLNVVQSALLNESNLLEGVPSGYDISNCLDLVKLLEEEGGSHEKA